MVTDCARCPLRQSSAFEDADPGTLAFLRKFKAGELRIDAGTSVLMEGSNTPQLFTALRGMGLRYKVLPTGERQVVNFILPGDFIGLQAGVMGEMKHSVEATTQMVLCVFDRGDLWSLYKQQPELAYDLTWLAAHEEHFLGDALASVGQLPAISRVAWALLRFFTRCKIQGLNNGNACPLPYRQQDIADALGLSLVHTNKTLMRLRREQLMSWKDGELRILDYDKLADLAVLEIDSERVRPLV